MPICEVRRRWRGDTSTRWPLVARQFTIAVGVVAAMTGVFWVLDSVLLLNQVGEHAAGQEHLTWSFRVSALMVTLGVLATVLGSVHAVRLCLRLRTVPRAVR